MEPLVTIDNITIAAIVIICTFLLGIAVIILYCYMLDKKRKKLFMNGSYSGISGGGDTNSYIYFGSPGSSFKADRKMSMRSSSGRKSSEDSSDLTPRRNSFLYSLRGSFHQVSRFKDKSRTTNDNEKNRVTETLNVCNFSTELEMTGFSKNVQSLQITTATASSLCEQCLRAPPSPSTPLLGTSISLPPSAVEITKTALGLTNPTSNIPIVCDSCLSPSKLGDTSRTLKLPNLTIGNELRQRRPSGIRTNPRSMNTYLHTMITDELIKVPELKFETSVDLSGHDNVEESFDSLLSPSRAYEWLSGNPLETSYEKSPDDPKLVKIQPKIKMSKHEEPLRLRKSQTSNQVALAENDYFSNGIFNMENKEVRKSPIRNTCFKTFHGINNNEENPVSYLEAFPPFTSPVISPGDVNYDYLILTPPKYFQSESNGDSLEVECSEAILHNATVETSCKTLLTCKTDGQEIIQDIHNSSPTMNAPRPVNYNEGRTDSAGILAWDSTFETLKTMENSMKLEVTPSRNIVNDFNDESHQDSNDSQLSVAPTDKSCVSNISLAWDNAGEHLDCGKQDSLQSLDTSMGSVDFDKLVCNVAPSLTKKNDEDNDVCFETKSLIKTRRNSDTDASSPLPKKYASSYDVSVHCNLQSEIMNSDRLYETSVGLQLRFNSPMRSESFAIHSPDINHDASNKSTVGNTDSLISQPFRTLNNSTSVCEAEEYLSTCESLDSFRTVMNF